MLDIQANRASRKYSNKELLLRVCWGVAKNIFAMTPRTMFRTRVWLLRFFGATIGKNVHIYPSASIYYPWNLTVGDDSAIGEQVFIYNLGPVTIGSRATLSHRAHLCAGTHDYRDPTLPLLKPPIRIGDHAWVCADAFIGPDVSIGTGAIVGARAAVFSNVDDWKIVVGNPARVLKDRQMHPSFSDKGQTS